MSPRDAAPAPRVLTCDGVFTHDHWHVVTEAAPAAAGELALLPLAQYLAEPQPPSRGVWLAPVDDPAALKTHLDSLPLIAIAFPVFSDGRGYSIATLLRTHHGFRGELRAIGDILVDQLFFLKRAGFSSFELRADQSPAAAVKALRTFSDAYQTSADTPLPAFRRHARPTQEAR